MRHPLIRSYTKKHPLLLVGIFALIAIGASYSMYRTFTKEQTVDPASYRPLLDLIAQGESKSNYNAYFGNPHNTTIDFTSMTINEVLAWQTDYIAQGAASSAVGRYQIINTTLQELVVQHQIDPAQKFDKTTQDSLAIALLERRGSIAYINGRLTLDQFAAELSKEWAALPHVTGSDPSASYYSHDGLNKALLDPEQVRQAIRFIHAR